MHIIAGLRIEALEEEQSEDDSINDQTTDSEGDEDFVVSDGETANQPSDFEVNNSVD